ncbi:MAG: SpoIID/LytB domain-containing protein, partial [Acidimicrobiia bacterium]|nr:SpoIID/LytB domain-containing protein [Acidimicrobiia bacterium]
MVVAALIASLLPAAPAFGASTTEFTITGGGFGHGVGMSQFGAYGMAREGFSAEEILTHYFTGIEVGQADPTFTEAPIWVNLLVEAPSVTFTVEPTGSADPVPAVFTMGDASVPVRAGESVTVEPTGAATCRVTAPGGTLDGDCFVDVDWDGWEPAPSSALVIADCYLRNWNHPDGTTVQPCTYARGTIHVRPDNNTPTLAVSVEIDIEDYVLGISEMPYAWGDTGGQEALEAQAIAARSYALARATRRADPAERQWCWCDIYDTPIDQAYVGWGHGRTWWIDAVRDTAGIVVTHPSITWEGRAIPLEAYYSSSTFGWTENSEDGFTNASPYLRSVDDHWSQLPEVGNHHARWSKTYTGDQLAALLPGLSSVTDAEITRCSATGAALEVTFSGTDGQKAFATKDLRSLLSIRSMQIMSIGVGGPDLPACAGHVTGDPAQIVEGGPVSLTSVRFDDDAEDDSVGDADGTIDPGELVEVWTTLTNDGADLLEMIAWVSSSDPHVTVAYNDDARFGDVAAGAAVEHADDWDLRIAEDAPAGHVAELTLTVDAANGGPWTIPFTVTVDGEPATDEPTDETPTDEAPSDDGTPAEDAPADDEPTAEEPTDETPTDEAPSDDGTPAEDAPADDEPTAEEPT